MNCNLLEGNFQIATRGLQLTDGSLTKTETYGSHTARVAIRKYIDGESLWRPAATSHNGRMVEALENIFPKYFRELPYQLDILKFTF